MIKVGKVSFSKPVAVVYNPTSGKKRDLRGEIGEKLTEHNIEFKFYET